LLPANVAEAGAVEVLGRQYFPPLAIAPLLLRQLLLLLQLLWGVGVCVASAIVVIVIVMVLTLR
jgi:hypothetical protein